MANNKIEKNSRDFTSKLQILMSKVGIKTFKELYHLTGTSERTINKLRSGEIEILRWGKLLKIASILQISVDELANIFSDRAVFFLPNRDDKSRQEITHNLTKLQQEYERLNQQFQQQRETLQIEFQQQSLQALESFLTYYPTAKQAATNNPDFPATKILPLLRSVEQLIAQWGVHAIGSVGAEIPYDPQWHQLIGGTANPGDLVKVRYVGYQHSEKLLFRAKVSN